MEFIDFLRDMHAQEYIGLDDDMPDHFESWLSQLDNQELIDYGEAYGVHLLTTIKNTITNLTK